MPGATEDDPAGCCDGIAGLGDAFPDGWRRHARSEHLALIHEWVGPPAGRWWKTDLFGRIERAIGESGRGSSPD